MDVHARKSAFDGTAEGAIEKAVEEAGQSALDANFSGAAIPGFLRTAHDFVKRERISISGLRASAKSAETATDKADVGEIDVAVDDVGDGFPDRFVAEMVGDGH